MRTLIIGVIAAGVLAGCAAAPDAAAGSSSGSAPKTSARPSKTTAAAHPPTTSARRVAPDLWAGVGQPIPDMEAYDATSNLEQRWSMQFDSKVIVEDPASGLPGGIEKTASQVDPDTGATLGARVRTDDDGKVRVFECSVTGELSLAADLLGFCASLPYAGSEPEKAQAWVRSHLAKVRQAHPATTRIGGVQLELSGATVQPGVGARTLELSKPS